MSAGEAATKLKGWLMQSSKKLVYLGFQIFSVIYPVCEVEQSTSPNRSGCPHGRNSLPVTSTFLPSRFPLFIRRLADLLQVGRALCHFGVRHFTHPRGLHCEALFFCKEVFMTRSCFAHCCVLPHPPPLPWPIHWPLPCPFPFPWPR